MDVEESPSLSLKLLVHKEKNEVVFAEADHDFVDVLFSFMTIPVGALIKLIGSQSFSCLSNLYASVENLDDKFLASKFCREVLLDPRSAGEIYRRDLKINIYETDSTKYFGCGCGYCGRVSYHYQDGRCHCSRPLQTEYKLPSPSPTRQHGFTKSTTRFMLSDDLQVRPVSVMACLTLLNMSGAGDNSILEERTTNVGKDKAIHLFTASMVAENALTDTFLRNGMKQET